MPKRTNRRGVWDHSAAEGNAVEISVGQDPVGDPSPAESHLVWLMMGELAIGMTAPQTVSLIQDLRAAKDELLLDPKRRGA